MNRTALAALGLAAALGATAIGTGLGFAGSPPADRPARAERVLTPKHMADRCKRVFAGASARLTFLETSIAPTEAQKPAWDAYKQAVTDAEAKNRDACVAAVPAKAEAPQGPPDIVTRETMKAQRLEAELALTKPTLPTLQKLYAVLTPEQRAVLDAPPHRGRHGGPRPAAFKTPDDAGPAAGAPDDGMPADLPPPATAQ